MSVHTRYQSNISIKCLNSTTPARYNLTRHVEMICRDSCYLLLIANLSIQVTALLLSLLLLKCIILLHGVACDAIVVVEIFSV